MIEILLLEKKNAWLEVVADSDVLAAVKTQNVEYNNDIYLILSFLNR